MTLSDRDLERFWARVERPAAESRDACWMWRGSRSFFAQDHEAQPHRLMFELVHGAVPDGYVVMLVCNHSWCVRPEHMRAMTRAERVLMGDCPGAQNARMTHCRRGHELPARVDEQGNVRRRRACRECVRAERRRRTATGPKRVRKPRERVLCSWCGVRTVTKRIDASGLCRQCAGVAAALDPEVRAKRVRALEVARAARERNDERDVSAAQGDGDASRPCDTALAT